MIDHTPTHVTVATAGTDHNLFITDTIREITSTGQDHTIIPNIAEAPTATKGVHPTLFPATKEDNNVHPLTDLKDDTPTRTSYTVTASTHP